jgi:23S rRNA (cytosine1962-C5)-methyltransferase
VDVERAFPGFEDAWIAYEDAHVVVVEKPPFVSSQAAEASVADDLVSRLRAWLEARGERQPYVGVHQRLDRDTSGLLLYARRREANAKLAAQFEGRKVKKTYLAAVEGWPAGRAKARLEGDLAPDEGGTMRVVRPGTRGAKRAVTLVRVLERRGPRALLELELETGRTHQARVQLAHAGAPIAGDALYAGPRAPRLMLHAAALSLAHPITGEPLRVASPAPRAMRTWLEHGDLGARVWDDAAALEDALRWAAEKRFALARGLSGSGPTSAFRLVHEHGDALPGAAVDVYGDWLVVQVHEEDLEAHGGAARAWDPARTPRESPRLAALLDALGARMAPTGTYLKVRPKQANVVVDTRREELAPREPVRGAPAPDPLTIQEEGLPFPVRLGDGLATGIYLDQRVNRARVRAAARGARVLNLFAYTCAFTLAAAAGGARETVSVDASAVALERGREALVAAGHDPTAHRFVCEDAFAWLDRAARRGERFDVVVLDPPSYSKSRARRFVAESDYAELAAAALRVLAPGGALLACTNHRGTSLARFRRVLRKASELAGRELGQLKDLPSAVDFPAPQGAEPTMKALWARAR